MADLTTVNINDLISETRQNLINDYIQNGTHAVNTMSLSIGGTEVISSARALTNITGVIPGTPPIGSVLPWAKSLSGVPALTTYYVECNGQTLSDAGSPLNGIVIPNLNGNNYFLRGNATSGGTGGAATVTLGLANLAVHDHGMQSHTHTINDHTHSGPSHSHSTPNHSHTAPSHTHSMSHTHSGPSHTHSISHTHTVNAHNHGVSNLIGSISTGGFLNAFATAVTGISRVSNNTTNSSPGTGSPSNSDSGSSGTGNTGASSSSNTGSGGNSSTSSDNGGNTGSASGTTGGSGTLTSNGPNSNTTTSAGSGSAFGILPPYYNMVMIMRVK